MTISSPPSLNADPPQSSISREGNPVAPKVNYVTIPIPQNVNQQQNDETPLCRICHDGEVSCKGKRQPLITPCKCCGTVGQIHSSCLERWLSTSNTKHCEICGFQYFTEQVPYSLLEYFKGMRTKPIVKSLIVDFVCFLMLVPLISLSIYLCFLGANEHYEGEDWIVVGLMLLCVFLLVAYLVWCHTTFRYHLVIWRTWQTHNLRVKPISLPTQESC